METIDSKIVQNVQLLPGIHGLRGIAALAVVLFHLQHLAGLDVPHVFAFIGRDLGYSVHLFFILSAFSLMHSTESKVHHQRWVHEYFIKRFFRIAPLFYFIILFELARQALFGGVVEDFSSILLNLTFTFGFVPFSGFVWGGWSVGVEMIFYAIFPVLILLIRTHRFALVFLVISVIVSYSVQSALHAQHLATIPQPKWDWSYFSFGSNISFFAMGLYAYRVSHLLDKDSRRVRWVIPFVAILLIGSLMFFDLGKLLRSSGRLDILVWGFGLSALCIWQSLSPSCLVANKIFELLGERSFSIYLVHPIVITALSKGPLVTIYGALSAHLGAYAFFVCAALVIPVVLVFAEFTYRLIEVSGINLGRRLITQGRKS
ncbi:MAG: acyltransferase [Pseudomonadota bacterium]